MLSTRHLKRTPAEKQQVKKRLGDFIELLGVSDAKFAINAGLDRRFVNSFTGNPSLTVRQLIASTYPALDMDWLLYGKGEMIKPDHKDNERETIPHLKPSVAQHYITPGVPNMVSEPDPVTGKIQPRIYPEDREPVKLDDIADHGLNATLSFTELLREKDKIIKEKNKIIDEKDKMIQFLLDQMQKPGTPCK